MDSPEDSAEDLTRILQSTFGFSSFRPHQEEVCRRAAEGRDVLLVMPTGAGKSLCYQIPGLARRGVTLVISPLIALMEDQAAKLCAWGLKAAAIHSGRSRGEARAACVDYLEDRLDFLFLAPERLSVPGLVEMLARHKPALIAVDEAHCISHWGHDFRPDYRLLKDRLEPLRPAPIVALTATATPTVQQDIMRQLNLEPEALSVHGFRRHNLSIEVVELPPKQRLENTCALLQDGECRPAIVYAPTRAETERMARELNGKMSAEAYHAGLPADERQSVQRRFLEGDTDVVVATIAFGMGIDKPDIRTVVHTSLPGSLEGYYQEIGRAGRDGEPSRAVLMFSFGDLKMHEHFFEQGYPKEDVLEHVFHALPEQPARFEEVAARVDLKDETFHVAFDKLRIHGGAQTVLSDGEECAVRGKSGWQRTYREQKDAKREQWEAVGEYARSHSCRMAGLTAHFGDRHDSQRPCGVCDVCAPDATRVRSLRAPSEAEKRYLTQIAQALTGRSGRSTGRLHQDLYPNGTPDRRTFEKLLGSLVRADLVELVSDSFTKEGKTITYKKARLTKAGRFASRAAFDRIRIDAEVDRKNTRSGATRASRKRGTAQVKKEAPAADAVDSDLYERLAAWRAKEAKRKKIPAYCILSNKALAAIASVYPKTRDELEGVHGVGPTVLEKYGTAILDEVRSQAGVEGSP